MLVRIAKQIILQTSEECRKVQQPRCCVCGGGDGDAGSNSKAYNVLLYTFIMKEARGYSGRNVSITTYVGPNNKAYDMTDTWRRPGSTTAETLWV